MGVEMKGYTMSYTTTFRPPLRNEFQTKFAVAMHIQPPTLNTEGTNYLMVLVPISAFQQASTLGVAANRAARFGSFSSQMGRAFALKRQPETGHVT